MRKFIISAVAAAAVAGSAYTLARAAAPDAAEGPGAQATERGGFVFDAKLAGMKAELKLTPEQEKLWPAFETSVRDAHKMRIERMRARHAEMEKGERPSPIARMTEISDTLAKVSDELKKIADAAKPLYDSFDETQKRQFGPLLMMLHGGEPAMGAQQGGQGASPL